METAIVYEVGEETTVATKQAGFDYKRIDEGIRDEVKTAAQVIRAQGHAMRSSILKIGRRLIEVKGMLPHGVFGEWIAAEFGMSERMGQNMMNVARAYEGKSEIVSFLSDTVLYLLSAPSMPEEARAEVEQAALAGQRVTVDMAKKAAAKFTEPKPTPARAEVKRVVEPYQAPTPTPAKVTYLEPRVIVEPDEPATEPTADELEAMALVAVETAGEDAERAERDAHRAPGEAVPTSILTREWVVFVLTGYDPINVDFATALKAATLDDLREALASLTTEEKHWRARNKALVSRFDELKHTPDPRIADAKNLIAILAQARAAAKADYGRLCGLHLDLVTYERVVESMTGRLQSLVANLEMGKEVTK